MSDHQRHSIKEMAARYLNLLIGRDGTEDDLREALSGKHPKTDASDDAAVFDEGEGLVLPAEVGTHRVSVAIWDGDTWSENMYLRVEHQPRDVLFGHAR